MRKALSFVCLSLLAVFVSTAHADLRMPQGDNFYDKAGRGIANFFLAPVNLLDSTYALTQSDGPTVAYSKGLVQGTSRMFMDMGIGVAEFITSPFPPYESFKQPAYDSGQVVAYPPADLMDNWY